MARTVILNQGTCTPGGNASSLQGDTWNVKSYQNKPTKSKEKGVLGVRKGRSILFCGYASKNGLENQQLNQMARATIDAHRGMRG